MNLSPEYALRHSSLSDQARRAIRALIITGELTPDEIYSVRHIVERLGGSATPVREAIIDLSRRGLVEVIRNRGFRVRLLDDHDLDEVVQLRLLLEVPVVSAVAGRLSAVDLGGCRRQAELFELEGSRANPIGYIDADHEFHLTLVSAYGNRRLVEVVEQLRDLTRLQAIQRMAASGNLQDSAREHFAILDAVACGDGEEAGRLTRLHIEHARGIWAGREESTRRLQGTQGLTF